MNDNETDTLKFIETYVNLHPRLKEAYIMTCPSKVRQMLDYLINITKDR